MTRKFFVVVAVLAITSLFLFAQSKPSIQGVWRVVEVTISNPNPLPGGLGKGTHTNVQPGLLIITGKHYSTVTDTAGKPRPTAPFKVTGKPTAEEMQAQWGPLGAQAGAYEVSGTTMTRRAVVAKNPGIQGGKSFGRYSFKLDGSNLWMTQIETEAGKTENAALVKYVRVE